MTIHFYTNSEEEESITSFYDIESNPFSKGDIVSISIENNFPRDYENYPENVRIRMLKINKEKRDKFHLKKIKLTKEGKYIKHSPTARNHLVIEYHCDILN